MKCSSRLIGSFFFFPLFLSSCATTGGPSNSRSEAGLKIIDAHIHTKFREPGENSLERTSKIEVTEVGLIAEMKTNGVVGAISHTAREMDGENLEGYEPALKKHGVIFCAGVGKKIFIQEIERGLKAGKYNCIKIYLGYIYRYATDPAYEPVYQLAARFDVPVVFHTGDPYDTDGLLKYADPMGIDEVAVKHRKVRFVIAHLGNPWIQTAAEVTYKNENVFVEASALLIGNMDELPREQVEEYVVKPIRWAFGYIEDPTKFLYGSDWPLNHMKGYINAYKRAIPREHWNAVFHDNAKRVFKLK